MKEPGFGPDMRDIKFSADLERQLDAEADAGFGMSVDPDSGQVHVSARGLERVLALHRRRWLWMAALQIAIIVPVSATMMFTQYQPGGPLPAPEFMMCLLMMTAVCISIGLCGYASFDAGRLDRMQLMSMSMTAAFFPIAGLLAWGALLLMFWRVLRGWDPGSARFLIADPFGLLVSCWVLALLSLRYLVAPLGMQWLRWQGDRMLAKAKNKTDRMGISR